MVCKCLALHVFVYMFSLHTLVYMYTCLFSCICVHVLVCLLFADQEDNHENSKLNKTETDVENIDSLTVDSDENNAFTTESHSYDWKSGEPLTCDFQASVFYY